MIITVTMNPAMDKTIYLQTLCKGELNRIQKSVLDAGGKGINVSKVVKELGGETIAMGFLAGSTGRMIQRVLEEKEIKTSFIYVEGETRTNTKIMEEDGTLTEINELGPQIPKEAIEELMEKMLLLAEEGTLFVLAGSVPKNVDAIIYKQIITKVKAKGAMVFLDADGALLKEGIKAGPNIVKPNQFELQQYFEKEGLTSQDDIISMGRELQKKGIDNVLISMGKEGAIFIIENKVLYAPGLDVKSNSSVGAGDAMVAAFAYGMNEKMGRNECIQLAMAASAGAVETEGTKPADKKSIEALLKRVVVQDVVQNGCKTF